MAIVVLALGIGANKAFSIISLVAAASGTDRFQIRGHAFENPDDGHVLVVGDAPPENFAGCRDSRRQRRVRRAALVRELQAAILFVAEPAAGKKVIDDDIHRRPVVFDERPQGLHQRLPRRPSSRERVEDLPMAPCQGIGVKRPFERLLDETIDAFEPVTDWPAFSFHASRSSSLRQRRASGNTTSKPVSTLNFL
jgi:hypothetical protein